MKDLDPDPALALATAEDSIHGNLMLMDKLGVPKEDRVAFLLTLLAYMELEFTHMERFLAEAHGRELALRGFNQMAAVDPGVAMGIANHERASSFAKETIRNAIQVDRSIRGRNNAQRGAIPDRIKKAQVFQWLATNAWSITKQAGRIAADFEVSPATAKNYVIEWRKLKKKRDIE